MRWELGWREREVGWRGGKPNVPEVPQEVPLHTAQLHGSFAIDRTARRQIANAELSQTTRPLISRLQLVIIRCLHSVYSSDPSRRNSEGPL